MALSVSTPVTLSTRNAWFSALLTWIVLASFPFYIAISAGATPLFRRRLDEKFERGDE